MREAGDLQSAVNPPRLGPSVVDEFGCVVVVEMAGAGEESLAFPPTVDL